MQLLVDLREISDKGCCLLRSFFNNSIMIKYSLFFIAVYFGGNSNILAQSQISSRQGESAIVTDSLSNVDSISRGTISNAGRNQQSIYTPSTAAASMNVHQESSAIVPTPVKAQPAIVDPKKQE